MSFPISPNTGNSTLPPIMEQSKEGVLLVNGQRKTVAILPYVIAGLGIGGGILAACIGAPYIAALAIPLLGLIGAVLAYYLCRDSVSVPTGTLSVAFLEQDNRLSEIESHCRTLKSQGKNVELQALLPKLQAQRQLVQDLNAHQPHLTNRDVANWQALFTNPIEPSYTDPITSKKYVMPNHGDLMNLIGDHFSTDIYTGFGFGRHECWKNPQTGKLQPANALYCKKPDLQVRARRGKLTWVEKNISNANSKVQEIEKNQRIKAQELLPKLEESLEKWNYESLHYCSQQDLKNQGKSQDCIDGRDVLLFFYKAIPESSVSIEEI